MKGSEKSSKIPGKRMHTGYYLVTSQRVFGRWRIFVSEGQKREARADLTEWVSNWGQCTQMATALRVEWHIYKWLASLLLLIWLLFLPFAPTRCNNIREGRNNLLLSNKGRSFQTRRSSSLASLILQDSLSETVF